MNTAHCTKTKKALLPFVLTRQNQKGQMAIFVALIFQVIFVFFALLINVGLLVHHKINLQQSADIAAYYGAMKQAEIMNAMAHINFQLRQNWKLLTWRYRILGTFGFQDQGAGSQVFPFQLNGSPQPNFNAPVGGDESRPALKCANMGGMGIQDIPFFCVGHSGMEGWPAQETTCRVNCNTFGQASRINRIPRAGIVNVPEGGNIAGAIDGVITTVNQSNDQRCQNLGKFGAAVLARFMTSYIYEARYRTQTMEMLAANLSLAAAEVRDLEGALILDGVKTTFKNNLTEANLTDFKSDEDAKFTVITGLGGNDGQGQCKFVNGLTGSTEFIKRIEFDYINYFIHNCIPGAEDPNNANSWDYRPEAVYDASDTATNLGPSFRNLDPNIRDVVTSLLGGPGEEGRKALHTIGYEKNPYCVEYYGVKATASPNIPFLPLKKIKLHATALAKPFGGSMGPWYGKQWSAGSPRSEANDTVASTRVDEALPYRTINGDEGVQDIRQSIYYQPNFSLWVGDRKGLRESNYIALYHSAFALRDIGGDSRLGFIPNRNTQFSYSNVNNVGWPSISLDWATVDNPSATDAREYDALANRNATPNTGMRFLEISAIAPNQFDLTYYSIEPDFYNNYYKKLYKGFDAIKAATGGAGPRNRNDVRPDFGAKNVDIDLTTMPDPLDPRTFSVKDQILVKNIVFNTGFSYSNPTYSSYLAGFKFLAEAQSSLLTGWTFLNFSNYNEFPVGPVDRGANSMTFGQCDDEWNNTVRSLSDITSADNFKTPLNDSGRPPAAGNCVTGGRTGYSVKIVAPNSLRTNGMVNALPSDFLSF